jgi:Lon protease-like protein
MPVEIIIPLFPLGVVLLPEMILPLHIFEERYKTMIGQCLDQDEEFGIVYFNGKKMEEVGCTARILKVLKRYDDGRMDILTKGNKRFEIIDVSDREACLQARVVYLDDRADEETEGFEKLAYEGVELLQELDKLAEKEQEYAFFDEVDVRLLSFLIPSHDGFGPQEKQKFLEMTSTRDRLTKGVESLKKVIERTKVTREIEHIIGGNGKIPKGLVNGKTAV